MASADADFAAPGTVLIRVQLAFICQTFFLPQKQMARHIHGNWPEAIRFNAEAAPLRQTTGNGTECPSGAVAGLECM
jgi:hypothetical protein